MTGQTCLLDDSCFTRTLRTPNKCLPTWIKPGKAGDKVSDLQDTFERKRVQRRESMWHTHKKNSAVVMSMNNSRQLIKNSLEIHLRFGVLSNRLHI